MFAIKGGAQRALAEIRDVIGLTTGYERLYQRLIAESLGAPLREEGWRVDIVSEFIHTAMTWQRGSNKGMALIFAGSTLRRWADRTVVDVHLEGLSEAASEQLAKAARNDMVSVQHKTASNGRHVLILGDQSPTQARCRLKEFAELTKQGGNQIAEARRRLGEARFELASALTDDLCRHVTESYPSAARLVVNPERWRDSWDEGGVELRAIMDISDGILHELPREDDSPGVNTAQATWVRRVEETLTELANVEGIQGWREACSCELLSVSLTGEAAMKEYRNSLDGHTSRFHSDDEGRY